jgi:hypothetical protein
MHVPFSLSRIIMSGLLLGMVLSVCTCWLHNLVTLPPWLVSTYHYFYHYYYHHHHHHHHHYQKRCLAVLRNDFPNSFLWSAVHVWNINYHMTRLFAVPIAGWRFVPSKSPKTAGFLSLALFLKKKAQPRS